MRRMGTLGAAVLSVLAVCVVVGRASAAARGAPLERPSGVSSARATFQAHGSVQQVYAVGLKPHQRVALIDRTGRKLGIQRADSLGGIVFRKVTPGAGYRLRAGSTRSSALTVLPDRSAPPSTRIYDQHLPAGGYGYLRTRDGTSLAIDVRLPGPADKGPYPTLVEYAGYGYADPAGPDSGIAAVGELLGFAVVDVNMRGTGCSGGSFDFFEPLQNLDGYDVIETVARQPWVLHHKVGMMGISYGAMSQLFVAATDPPALAAIAPLSTIDDIASTLYPGGILNTGFAVTWTQERQHDALPASSTGGQAWALKRIQAGDQTCRANQVLHGEAPNLLAKVRANSYYVPSVADPLSPVTFVHKIHVPVYLACQWTDEQISNHCADLAEHFTGTRRAWFTFANGAHIDSLDPATFDRWYDFLELYVAHRAPQLSSAARALVPTLYQTAMGISGVTLPADPIQSEPSYASALSAFQRLAPIRVLFDNGAGSATPGAPYPGFEHSFTRFPIPGMRARSWYLNDNGALTAGRAARAERDVFTWNPRARPATSFSGSDDGTAGGLWTATPTYHWDQNPAEVRPDGKETFVQDGWLRASERKLDPAKSTLLEPVLSLRRADAAPLPAGRYTEVTVPLYYEGHAYRRGSRIRVTIEAPGGDQPVWGFAETNPTGTAKVSIAHSAKLPSRLILPVVPGVSVPTGLPPCPGLRGEPCRAYAPYHNDSAPVS
jgi:uncharacterized protein